MTKITEKESPVIEGEIVEATIVEGGSEPGSGDPETAMVPADSPEAHGVMMPFDAEEVQEAMTAYQKTVRATLDPSDWQGQPGGKGSFVKKSGWRKIAKAFGLSVTRVDDGVERDDEGNPVRAWAIYRAAHPNGQTQDGDGYCSTDESRFARSGGRQKLENDLRATATTRAKNRAISDLVGMGEVSAEEIAVMAQEAPAFEGDLSEAWEALQGPVGGDQVAAKLDAWIQTDNDGTMPRSVGRALVAIGRAIKSAEGSRAEEPAPASDDDLPF